jgi:uncharacterized protein (TIGR00369 family)
MRKIHNPFPAIHKGEDYHCFGCSPLNSHGLNLEFWDEGEEVFSIWLPSREYEGYPGIIHGGILATIMDETASWYVYTKLETSGVTAEMTVRYLKPVRTAGGALKTASRVLRLESHRATLQCAVSGNDGTPCAIAEITFFLYPEKIAVSRYHYPGKEAFYPERSKNQE